MIMFTIKLLYFKNKTSLGKIFKNTDLNSSQVNYSCLVDSCQNDMQIGSNCKNENPDCSIEVIIQRIITNPYTFPFLIIV